MRKYLPTLGELIDRLTIVQLKEVKIPKHKKEYEKEIKDIVHDINQILLDEKYDIDIVDGETIRAIIVLAQMNTHIWVNEDNARNGDNKGNIYPTNIIYNPLFVKSSQLNNVPIVSIVTLVILFIF